MADATPEQVVAYFRVPVAGPVRLRRWPADDAAAAEQLLQQLLLGSHSGRRHLPAALARSGRAGLALLIVQRHLIVDARRLTRITADGFTIRRDPQLAGEHIGARIDLPGTLAVQIWLTPEAIGALSRPPQRLQFPQPRLSRTITAAQVKQAMDQPPTW